MDLIAVIERMEAQGMDPAAILTAVKCIAAEQGEAVERRRSSDRERQARHRAKKVECHVTERDVTVTECDTPSPLVPPFPPAPPIPPIIPPTPASLGLDARDLESELRKAAGWEREPAPNLCVTGPIEALIASGAILETDVLPVVKAHAPRVRRPSSWKYFVPIIQDAVQARIAAGTGPPKAGEVVPFANPTRSQHGPRLNTIAAGFELLERAIEREERAIAEAQGGHGVGQDDPLALPRLREGPA